MQITSLIVVVTSALAISTTWAKTGHDAPAGVAPGQALKLIQEGNERFVSGKVQRPRQDAARRQETASGQKPHTIVLSCADSRVPPEVLFDQGIGDLFVVRVAGNILGAATVASMEYAVEHLGARLILVMGHDSCGAVKAALQTPKGESAGSADLDSLVASIRPGISEFKASVVDQDKRVIAPVKKNVSYVAKDLLRRSKILRGAVEEGKIAVAQGIYMLDSGKVEFWDVANLGASKSSQQSH
jgi:carbonic anhydrase